jgi:hypothetical protein
MAFGQQSGPPSSARQVEEIAALLESAGYDSLREARHPYGLSQRQANGKFTQGEAVELIERLQSELAVEGEPERSTDPVPALPATGRTRSAAGEQAARREADRQAELLVAVRDDALADELVRRGWICMPPA